MTPDGTPRENTAYKVTPRMSNADGTRYRAYTTRVGKYPRLTGTQRLSQQRATNTITETTLPTTPINAREFMSKFKDRMPKLLADGGQGSVYSLTVTDASKHIIDTIYAWSTNRISRKSPSKIPNGTRVVIKVMALEDHARDEWDLKKIRPKFIRNRGKFPITKARAGPNAFDALSEANRKAALNKYSFGRRRHAWMNFLKKAALDASNHDYLMKAAPISFACGGDAGRVTVSARDVIPDFYFGGSITKYGVYVVVMGLVDGVMVEKVKPTVLPASSPSGNKTAPLSPTAVANLEKAMLILAASGVEHGDAHTQNVYVLRNDHVHLIDFGMSVILPKAYRDFARKSLMRSVKYLVSTKKWPEVWSNMVWYGANGRGKNERSIMRYMNSYMQNDKFTWYNPSGKLLRWAREPYKNHKDLLNASRAKVWLTECSKPSPRRSPPHTTPKPVTTYAARPTKPSPKRNLVPRSTAPPHPYQGTKSLPRFVLNYGNL